MADFFLTLLTSCLLKTKAWLGLCPSWAGLLLMDWLNNSRPVGDMGQMVLGQSTILSVFKLINLKLGEEDTKNCSP